MVQPYPDTTIVSRYGEIVSMFVLVGTVVLKYEKNVSGIVSCP